MTTFWPGTTTPKSTGNAFDLSLRPHSIFYNPKRPPPLPTTRFGKAPTGITIGKSSDGQRRRQNAKAGI